MQNRFLEILFEGEKWQKIGDESKTLTKYSVFENGSVNYGDFKIFPQRYYFYKYLKMVNIANIPPSSYVPQTVTLESY